MIKAYQTNLHSSLYIMYGGREGSTTKVTAYNTTKTPTHWSPAAIKTRWTVTSVDWQHSPTQKAGLSPQYSVYPLFGCNVCVQLISWEGIGMGKVLHAHTCTYKIIGVWKSYYEYIPYYTKCVPMAHAHYSSNSCCLAFQAYTNYVVKRKLSRCFKSLLGTYQQLVSIHFSMTHMGCWLNTEK